MKRMSVLVVVLLASVAFGQDKKMFSDIVGADVAVQKIKATGSDVVRIPFQSWCADLGFLYANGGMNTVKGSIYDKMGLKIEFYKEDYFPKQVQDVRSSTPFIRGAYSMYALASEYLSVDQRTTPTILFIMSYSVGDHVIARADIKTLNDLKPKAGKKIRIACQQGGAHVGMLAKILDTVLQIKKEDVQIVWVKELVGYRFADPKLKDAAKLKKEILEAASNGQDAPCSAAEMMFLDPTISAAFAVTPDAAAMITMDNSGNFGTGTGAENTIKGAHLLVSTRDMSRAIPDVMGVRTDWFEANRDFCEKFTAGYLKSVEELATMRKEYEDGKGKSKKIKPEYLTALKLMQSAFGTDVVPTPEIEGHGYLLDCTFPGLPGQIAFYEDASNLNGFDAEMKSNLTMASSWGYIKNRRGFNPPSFDYQKLARLADIKYIKPQAAVARIAAESLNVYELNKGEGLAEFQIEFLPNAATFSLDRYAADFERIVKMTGDFGNCVVIVKGHTDPSLTVMSVLEAGQVNAKKGKSKGCIVDKGTGKTHVWFLDGEPLDVKQIDKMVQLIESGAFNEKITVYGRNSDGNKEAIVEDATPMQVAASAQALSLSRANAVKKGLLDLAKEKGWKIDASQIQPMGCGISEPLIAKPKDRAETQKNMRVSCKLSNVPSESIKTTGELDY